MVDIQTLTGGGAAAGAGTLKAWVNFNGTGTVAIRSSGNVSSITDNGTGDYTVNFTTALADANYSVAPTVRCITTATNQAIINIASSTAPSATACRFFVIDRSGSGVAVDPDIVSAIFVR